MMLDPYYNGTFAIGTVPNSTTFTYQMTGTPTGAANSGTFGALWQVGRLAIENNLIELLPAPTSWGPPDGILMGWGPASFPVFLQVLVRGNLIHNVDNGFDSSGLPVGIRQLSCGEGVVEDNVIDLNSIWNGPPLYQQDCAPLKYFNNQTSAGNLIQAFDFDIERYLNEISPDADLALIQAL
jgi:hypothetical protein